MRSCVRAADRSDRVSVCLSTWPNYRVRLSTGHFARNCDFPRVCRAPVRYWLQPLPQTRHNAPPRRSPTRLTLSCSRLPSR